MTTKLDFMWNLKNVALIGAMLVNFSFSNPEINNYWNYNSNYTCWEEVVYNLYNQSNIHNTNTYIEKKIPKKRIKRSTLLTSRLNSEEKRNYETRLIPNSLQDSIYQYMKLTLKVPEAAFALAWHESGGFSSKLWREGNNPFGMKATKSLNYDFTVWSVGDQHWKAGWNHWKQAIDNFAAWEERKKINAETPEQYVRELRRIGYAEDPYHGSKVLGYVAKIFTFNK